MVAKYTKMHITYTFYCPKIYHVRLPCGLLFACIECEFVNSKPVADFSVLLYAKLKIDEAPHMQSCRCCKQCAKKGGTRTRISWERHVGVWCFISLRDVRHTNGQSHISAPCGVEWPWPQNCEKRLWASSCLSSRMEQLGSYWTDFDEVW
jgi:hypothetical protein